MLFLKRLFALPEEAPAREDQLRLAGALLLFEVAKADHSLAEAELLRLRSVLAERWRLPEDELEALMRLCEQESELVTSLHEQVALINDSYSSEQKVALMLAMWQVAYADGEVHHHEEHVIRRVGDLLYVSHGDFIRTKHIAEGLL